MNPQAKERERAWRRAYYHQNKRKIQAQQRSYRDKNREKLLAQKRAYRETHKTERLKWLRKNRPKLRAYKRAYYKENRDRVLAAQHSRYDAKRQFVTPEELEACRQDPRKAKTIAGPDLIVCLECGEKLKTLCRHLGQEHSMTADAYKRKPGPDGKIRRYDHKTNLMSVSFSTEISRKRKRWRQGRWVAKYRPPVEKLIASRGPRNWSLESRLNRRDWKQAITQRDQWKKRADGTVVEDLQIAQLRLQGMKTTDIARRVGLSGMPVILRLRRMGFPRGHACLFQHGEPLTSQHLVEICKDFDLKRTELARMIEVPPTSLCHHLKHYSIDKTLPLEWAKQLLRVQKRLKVERPMKSSNPKGGRPRELLPSEEKCIRRQYGKLMRDQLELRRWFENYEERVSTRTWKPLCGWLCEQRRLGKIEVLLFWPEFFDWLKKTFKRPYLQGRSTAKLGRPLTLDFLARSFHVSPGTIIKIVWPSSR